MGEEVGNPRPNRRSKHGGKSGEAFGPAGRGSRPSSATRRPASSSRPPAPSGALSTGAASGRASCR